MEEKTISQLKDEEIWKELVKRGYRGSMTNHTPPSQGFETREEKDGKVKYTHVIWEEV